MACGCICHLTTLQVAARLFSAVIVSNSQCVNAILRWPFVRKPRVQPSTQDNCLGPELGSLGGMWTSKLDRRRETA